MIEPSPLDNLPKLDSCGNRGFAETRANTGPSPADLLRTNCGFADSAPLPLPERSPAPDFPLDALGPILGDAARQIAYYTQAPAGIAGASVLAAAALVAQPFINVRRGSIGTGPVSLFCLTVAGSGDRKSTVDRIALAPVRDFERARIAAGEAEWNRFRAEDDAWSLARELIGSAARGKKGQVLSRDQQRALSAALEEHEATRPKPPKNPNITFAEPTAEGVWRHFQRGEPSSGLFSDEAVSFFGGHGMAQEARGRTIGTLSQLWDGSPMIRTRAAEGESGVMQGRRLSAHLMVQPIVAAEVLSDPVLMGQGFLARFLICQEPSLAGGRFLAGRDLSRGPDTDPAIGRYWARLAEILRQPMPTDDSGGLEPAALDIRGDAFAAWVALHDWVESQLGRGGQLADITAFASKAAENAARIAAVFAFVEGARTVDIEHVKRAGVLAAYFLESMLLRTREAQHDLESVEAAELLDWIRARGGSLEAAAFKVLPSGFRSSKKARGLLGLLVAMGHLRVTAFGGRNKPAAWEVVTND